jgi:ribonuclease III
MANFAVDIEGIVDQYYSFNEPALLRQALTHMSWLNEHRGEDVSVDNQRLEFLGDAVLKAIQSRVLYDKYPDWDEGRLTSTRGHLENNRNLAVWCQYLGLDKGIRVGRGISRDPKQKSWDGICAQVFEAFLGAVWEDSGYNFSLLFEIYTSWDLPAVEVEIDNAKGKLQELVQRFTRTGGAAGNPDYSLVSKMGPDHDLTFTIQCSVPFSVPGGNITTGTGSSKQEAAVDAARKMYRKILPMLDKM